jgi:hypothetical protein
MTTLDCNTNVNFLSPTGFILAINRLPEVSYMCQAATLPSLRISPININNPMLPVNVASTKAEFQRFSVQFKVDEDMNNYYSLYQWMAGLTFSRHDTQYYSTGPGLKKPLPDQGPRSDGSLLVLNSVKNVTREIVFTDLFPEELMPLEFNTQDAEISYITCNVIFSYRMFDVRPK